MSSFEPPTLSSGKNDPAATDLDYYSKPENYTGSNLQSLQKFTVDKKKEDDSKKKKQKKRIVKDASYYFFYRYKHLLQDAIFMEDLLDREKEAETDNESDDEDVVISETGEKSSQVTKSSTKITPEVALPVITEDEEEQPDQEVKRQIESRTENDRKSCVSVSTMPSGIIDDRGSSMSPDSMGSLTPGGGKSKRSTAGSPNVGRQSMAIQRANMDKMSKEIRGKQMKEKFIKAVTGVKCICRLVNSARGSKGGGDSSSMQTFMDIASDDGPSTEENMKNAGLSFDPNFFKAKREISLSSDTKAILTTPSERRTEEQVQTAMFGLQSLRSYAEYPLHMQAKLAKVAWYEVVPPKRIIIRQGHFAENFYFMLSGNAVVTILLKDPKTGASFVKIATVMKKGMSFGELALLHHSKRTATVTSKDTVQLLSIGREDFFDIFMATEGDDPMPAHIRFISNLDFMKHWPIEELLENPQHCLLHFFKRNTTIVANSNQSEWMYIVKSGSCQVLKKLKGVTAKCEYTKPKIDDSQFSSPKMKAIVFAPMIDSGLRKRKKSPEKTPKPTSVSDEKDNEEKHVKFSKERYSQKPETKKAHFSAKSPTLDTKKSTFAKRKGYEPPARCKPKKVDTSKESSEPAKPGPVFVQVSTMKPRDIFGLESIQFDDDVQRTNTSVSLISGGAELVMLNKEFYIKHANEAVKSCIREFVRPYPEEEVFQDNLQIKEDWVMYKKPTSVSDEKDNEEKHVKFSKERYSQKPETKKAHFSAKSPTLDTKKSTFAKRKGYEPPARCKPKKVDTSKESSEPAKPGPVFVQVSTMKPRDIFGLESIQFDDDVQRTNTSVSLISGGAELVMLNKEFYIKHANEAVKSCIREFVRPYPEEEVFQDNLQIKEDWVMYKKVMLVDLTSEIIANSNRFNS